MPQDPKSTLDAFIRAGNRLTVYYDEDADGHGDFLAFAELKTPNKRSLYEALGLKGMGVGDSVLAAVADLGEQLLAREEED